jgi:SMI1 / KNR4 family (SUKH-1)
VISGRLFKVKNQGIDLNEATMLDLEKKLGFSIPNQLRQCYLKYNGGNPAPAEIDKDSGFWVGLIWNPNTQPEAAKTTLIANVSWFFEIDPSKYDLWKQCLTKKDNLPGGMLPFTHDFGGRLCRYITRPALANERVKINAKGQAELKL